MLRFTRRAAVLAALVAAPSVASAQAAAYPIKPIRMLVGFAPGGAVDVVARNLAEEMGRDLGQSIVVENRAGASGNIASAEVAKASPDGYTLMLGNGPQLAINPHLFRELRFDPARDLVPIGQAATVRFVAVVPVQSAATTLRELVALTRQKPINYASSGIGSVQHLGAEVLKAASGAEMTHVVFRGSGPLVTELIAGRLDFAIDAESVVAPHILSGALRGLAMMAAARSPGLPAVPTVREAGFEEIVVEGWQGLVAPVGLPPAVSERLDLALRRTHEQEAFRKRLEAATIAPVYRDAAAFARFIAAERERFGAIVKRLGLQPG